MPSAARRDASTEVWPLQCRSRLNTSISLWRPTASLPNLSPHPLPGIILERRAARAGPQADSSYSLDIFPRLLLMLVGREDTVAQPKCSADLRAVKTHLYHLQQHPHTHIQTSPKVQHRWNCAVLVWSTLSPAPQHRCRVAMETVN